MEKFDFITAWHDADKGQTTEKVVLGLPRDLQGKLQNILGRIKFELDLGGILKIAQSDQKEKSTADLVGKFCSQVEKAYKVTVYTILQCSQRIRRVNRCRQTINTLLLLAYYGALGSSRRMGRKVV